MSAELTKARTLIAQVKTFLKQDKVMSAAQSLHDALVIVMTNPLMKAEKDEFGNALRDAVDALGADEGWRRRIGMAIDYAPGGEKALLTLLRQGLTELKDQALSEAKDQLDAITPPKAEGLAAGQALLEEKRFEDAKRHFDGLISGHQDDPELKSEVGERFLKAERFEEAYGYFEAALKDNPESIHLYNRIGMSLRKLGRFETSEGFYTRALEIAPDDYNLYFNLGRLYIDWKKWDLVEAMAQAALGKAPEFLEAKKMLAFARKKLAAA